MHGMIFAELKKFVETNVGGNAWTNLTAQAGLGSKIYLTGQEYPDEEVVALVTAASATTNRPADDILQDFGEFIVPDLLKLYGALLDKKWKTLDVIEFTESTIHRVVRLRNPGAKPPVLSCERPGANEVLVSYSSSRKMCGIAKGIVRGIAKHFGEIVTIDERSCMLTGADKCLISVTLTVS